jgi:hypothetical protein
VSFFPTISYPSNTHWVSWELSCVTRLAMGITGIGLQLQLHLTWTIILVMPMTKSLTLHKGSMFSKSLTYCEKNWIHVENKLHKKNIEIVKEKTQVICQNFLWTTWVNSQSKTKK